MSTASDFARRAVACPRWRWMPRMVDQLGRTVLAVRDGMCLCAWKTGPAGVEQPALGWLRIEQMGAPDLDDPATVGCLEALVCEPFPGAYAKPMMSIQLRSLASEHEQASFWSTHEGVGFKIADGPTKAAALVAALESAP